LLGGHVGAGVEDGAVDGLVLEGGDFFDWGVQILTPSFGEEEAPLAEAAVVDVDFFGKLAAPGGVLVRLAPAFDE
jgi:hypothetical protein